MNDMNMCPICGDENIEFTNNENQNLEVMGLPLVIAKGIHVYTCSGCNESFEEYPVTRAFKEYIVRSLVTVKRPLTGKEVAFIRKNLGYSATKWSTLIGVNNVTLSNWENEKKKHNKTAEMALRMRAALALEISPTDIASVSDEAIVEISALPITTPLSVASNWANTNKIMVNA